MKIIRQPLFFITVLACGYTLPVHGQQPSPSPLSSPPRSENGTASAPASQPPPQSQRSGSFDLSEYGVSIQPDARLIVMMVALEAAGFDPVASAGGDRPLSPFRAEVRRDVANLDADLRARLRDFYERNKLPATATPAEQAARYVSLAFALGAAPAFESPARVDDLPEGVQQVLDFAALLRDFYRRSGIEARLPHYTQVYQAEGDRLRPRVAETIRATLSYLRTRPTTTVIERIPVTTPSPQSRRNNTQQQRFTVRERARRFVVVPDLLAASGALNFLVIGDDYYAVVPPTINPAASELRRAYLLYTVDPLVSRFNREIAARRADLRALIDAQTATNAGTGQTAPSVFPTIARSLVAAADVRMTQLARLGTLARETSARLQAAGANAAERARITAESNTARTAITDESIADLADAYERGAVLAFYFADQLRGVESSGFDITNSFADMIASFDVARERSRLTETAAARERGLQVRRERETRTATAASAENMTMGGRAAETRAALIRNLDEVETLLRAGNHAAAEARLQVLLREFQGEPRIHFALAQTASRAAQDATDSDPQEQLLNRALSHYRLAIAAASPDADRALLSRAHVGMARILAFLNRNEEAATAFDAAITLGRVEGGAYNEAVAERQLLTPRR